MYLKQNQWDWEPEPLKDLTKDRFEEKLKRHELERKEGNIYYFCIKERGSKNIIETDLKTPDVTK